MDERHDGLPVSWTELLSQGQTVQRVIATYFSSFRHLVKKIKNKNRRVAVVCSWFNLYFPSLFILDCFCILVGGGGGAKLSKCLKNFKAMLWLQTEPSSVYNWIQIIQRFVKWKD